VEVVASLSQGRTAAGQCGLFTHKSVPVVFEPSCMSQSIQHLRHIPTNFKFYKRVNNCALNNELICFRTVSTTGLFVKYSYSDTLVKYLPGHCERVPTIRAVDRSTHRIILTDRTHKPLVYLSSINEWWEIKKYHNKHFIFITKLCIGLSVLDPNHFLLTVCLCINQPQCEANSLPPEIK